jgi:hypothetical protein
MNAVAGAELLEAIAELRTLFPEWRFGQLVANLTMAAGHLDSGAIWDVDDAAMLTAARRLIETNRDRRVVGT